MKIQENGSIKFYCQVMPNTFVQVLEPADTATTLKQTMNKLTFQPSFLLVVNCILRSLKFKEDRSNDLFSNILLERCKNTSGFVSYGEQYMEHHVNQTMVLLAIE
jgi:hypothetical protein